MAAPPPPAPWRQRAAAHLAQAQHNHRLYRQLRAGGEFLDWAMTALFYTALHLIQACLIDMASDAFDYPRGHTGRDSYISRKLPSLLGDYNFLQTRCNEARYHPDKPRPTAADPDRYE